MSLNQTDVKYCVCFPLLHPRSKQAQTYISRGGKKSSDNKVSRNENKALLKDNKSLWQENKAPGQEKKSLLNGQPFNLWGKPISETAKSGAL